tara:strand:+ start:164 stop:376 length:213 start_codon:yes stop_codon:yes gene_type:complete
MDTDKFRKITTEMQDTARANGQMTACIEMSNWIEYMMEEEEGLRPMAPGYLTALNDMLNVVDGILKKINS